MNPYGILIATLAALALAIGAYFYGRTDGRTLERSAWVSQQNSDLRTANQAIDAAHRKARAEENAKAEALSKVSASYQKGLKDGKAAEAAVIDDLRAGNLRLRVGITGCEAIGSAASKAASGPAGRDGGTSAELSKSAAEFLVGLASEADAVVKQLTACQAIVRKDRE